MIKKIREMLKKADRALEVLSEDKKCKECGLPMKQHSKAFGTFPDGYFVTLDDGFFEPHHEYVESLSLDESGQSSHE